MGDPCFSPRGLAPAGDPLLTPQQWAAIRAFGADAAAIDVGALQARLTYLLPITMQLRRDDESQGPDPAQIARANASVQPCLNILQQVHAATPPLLASFDAAQALGTDLAAFAQQAVQRLTDAASAARKTDADPTAVAASLAQLQTLAAANAAAARKVCDALVAALASTSALLAAFDASIAAAYADLRGQGATPADQASLFLDTTLQPLNTTLQGLAPQLQPGLAHVAGAWNSIALELQAVIAKTQTAGSAALRDEPCLAADALAIAADEWRGVGADVEAFLRSLTTTAAEVGVVL